MTVFQRQNNVKMLTGEEIADELNSSTEFELKVQKFVSKLKRLERKLDTPYANVNVMPIVTGTIPAQIQ